MPYKEKSIEKQFWTIGEVAQDLGVNTSLIRYWEKEFGTIRPKRTGRGDRSYTRKDIDLLKRIQHLVKEKGFTLQGAREQLKKGNVEEEAAPNRQEELVTRLSRVRDRLMSLRDGAETDQQ